MKYVTDNELADILRENEFPWQFTKWNKMVEIIKSEEVTPRTLLGQLETHELDGLYRQFFEDGEEHEREEIIRRVIKHFDLGWMDKSMESAFIMMSMGGDPDLERTCKIIKDECERCNVKAIRIDDIQTGGQITDEILDKIKKSRYLIIDLSMERPNVYYEAGYAHGLEKDRKNIVFIAKAGTKIHFDIRNMRTILYDDQNHLRKEFRKRLTEITKEP